MAHTLKLTIWKLLLKPNYGDPKTPNSELFSRMMEHSQKQEPLEAFLDLYLKYFSGEFKKNQRGNQSFTPKKGGIRIKKDKNLIYGFLEGGPTGIESKVKPNSDAENEGKDVSVDEVISLDNYFHLWIPPDVNYCYIMLHNYSDINRGIASAFHLHFEKFLRIFRYNVNARQEKVPEPIKNAFKERSVIIGMDIIKDKTSPVGRRNFNPGFQEAKKLNYRLSIGGLSYGYNEFIEKLKYHKGNPFFIDLSDIGITDPRDYKLKVKYRDPISKRIARSELSDLVQLRPAIIIPDDVKQEDSEYPDIDKIFVFCDKQLQMLLLEEDYRTIDEH